MRKKYTTVTQTILEEKRILLGNLSRNYNKVTKRIASGDIFTRLDCGTKQGALVASVTRYYL